MAGGTGSGPPIQTSSRRAGQQISAGKHLERCRLPHCNRSSRRPDYSPPLNFETPTAAATPNRTAPRASAAAASPTANGHPTLGAMDAIRTTLATTAKVIRTRLEIISCELEEQREWMQS